MKDLRHKRQGDLPMIPQLAEPRRDNRTVHHGDAVKSGHSDQGGLRDRGGT